VDGEQIVDGLQFPEGPVWVGGAIWFTEITGGFVSRWTPESGVERIGNTGGGPNGATAGADGSLYVTQNGGMGAGPRTTPGIQRVAADGSVDVVATEVAGVRLDGPNDLAFGDDGRLWFTDPRGDSDPNRNGEPGRIFAIDPTTGEGELVIELDPVFPNGIGFLADGTLVWTESFTRRVMRLVDGTPEVIIELPERHWPDGFCVGADGRLYVASTFAHCVSVIDDGRIVDRLVCGDGMITNCCFGGPDGTDLYLTESRHGTLWRFPVGVEGLALRT
jgi:gluconolactonase